MSNWNHELVDSNCWKLHHSTIHILSQKCLKEGNDILKSGEEVVCTKNDKVENHWSIIKTKKSI